VSVLLLLLLLLQLAAAVRIGLPAAGGVGGRGAPGPHSQEAAA
jgi:hypothetical protein